MPSAVAGRVDLLVMDSHQVTPLRRIASLAAGLCAIALLTFGSADAVAAPVEAKQADSFVESIGVNVHLTYSDTPYGEFSKVDQSLKELGVRYIRDGVGLGRPDVYSEYRALAAQGIKLDLIVGDPLQRYGIGSLQQQLNMIEQNFPEAIATLEGPNEYDQQGDPNWITDLRNYVRSMWEEINARPALASRPIIGPTIVQDEHRTEAGELSQWTDQGNMHPYPGGQMPDLTSHAESEFSLAARNTASQPVEATETGYQNAVNEVNAGNRPVSEKAGGIYTPRMYLDNFRRGIVRTYDYELVDTEEDPSLTEQEAHFGLVKNNWAPKPAYTALQRLIKLTADPGPTFSPEPLSFRIPNAPSTERQVLLERRDGTYDLVLWNAVSVWNTQTLTELNPASPTMNLSFEQPIEKVEVFRPNEAEGAVSTAGQVESMSLQLSPSVTVLHVIPSTVKAPQPSGPEPLQPNTSSSTSTPAAGSTETSSTAIPGPSAPAKGSPTPAPSATTTGTASAPAGTSSAPAATSGVTPSVRAKLRAIARRVHTGCARGCPLKGSELEAARSLLHRNRAGGSANGPHAAQTASWLQRRKDDLGSKGTLAGPALLHFLTIELVLKTAGQSAAA
jgi:hypothetical protein